MFKVVIFNLSHNPEIGYPIVDDMTMAKKKEENNYIVFHPF